MSIELISTNFAGGASNGAASGATISATGRYVVYQSNAGDVTGGNNLGLQGIYLKDMETGVMERIDRSGPGQSLNGEAGKAAISPDGRYVVYTSTAGNIVAGDDNNTQDVFLYDRLTHQTSLISKGLDGTSASGPSWFEGEFSGNSRYVSFGSYANDISRNDWNTKGGTSDVFLYDIKTGQTAFATGRSPFGQVTEAYIEKIMSVSNEGKFVTQWGYEYDLKQDVLFKYTDTSTTFEENIHIFSRETTMGPADGPPTRVVTVSAGSSGNGTGTAGEFYVRVRVGDSGGDPQHNFSRVLQEDHPRPQGRTYVTSDVELSKDGRYVVYASDFDVHSQLSLHNQGLFVWDIYTNTVVQIGAADGTEYTNLSVSADGRWITFETSKALVDSDTNGKSDIYRISNVLWRAGEDQPAPEPDYDGTNINGTPNNDDLLGTSGRDRIDALAGDDRVLAGGGDDAVYGRGGEDTLAGEEGRDRLFGESEDDVLLGGADNDYLDGGDGDDLLYGDTAPADEAHPGDGDDDIDGGKGDDVMYGGGGVDQMVGEEGDDTIYGGDGDDRILGAQGSDLIYGGDGDDLIFANLAFEDGEDTIYGGAGRDDISGVAAGELVFGEAGDDKISGYGGNDTLVGGDGGDFIDGGDGHDLIFGGDDDFLGEADGQNGIFGGAGDDTIWGGPGGALVDGGDGFDRIQGGDGIDALDGGAGEDKIFGGNGDDILRAGEDDTAQDQNWLNGDDGDDELFGGAGGDLLYGGLGDDTITGGGGDDEIRGFEPEDEGFIDGHDLVLAGEGKDSIWGSTGEDALFGEEDDDVIYGEDGDDAVIGGEGKDQLSGGDGDDVVDGGDDDDQLAGGLGGDTLIGGGGSDFIDGGEGDDLIYVDEVPEEGDALSAGLKTSASGGGSTLRGGAGHDTFVLSRDGVATIVDLTHDDQIDLRKVLEFRSSDGNPFQTGELQLVSRDGGTALMWDRDGSGSAAPQEVAFLAGVAKEQVSGANFKDVGGVVIDPNAKPPILGTPGADVLKGTEGDDIMKGAAGADVLRGGGGRDQLFGDNDDDGLYGEAGNDTLSGGGGGDNLDGGDGDDSLSGGLGHDVLRGGNGADTISGDYGNDTLYGMTGDDVFVATLDVGQDQIRDFKAGAGPGDRLDLTVLHDVHSFADLADRLSADASGNAVVRIDTNTTFTLMGVKLTQLDAGDFIFA